MKKFLTVLLALSLMATMLSGCGKQDVPDKTDASKTTTKDTEQQNVPDKKVLNVATLNEYPNMIQWLSSTGNTWSVMSAFSEGLIRLDGFNNPQPGLAETYDISDDGLTYTFHLRDNIFWSNGEPVTADDFVYAWTLLMTPDAENTYYFIATDYIKNGLEYFNGECTADQLGLKAVDPKTFEVTLKLVTSYFVRLTATPVFYPLNRKFIESCGDKYATDVDKLLYCGPFTLTKYDPAVGVTLTKNKDYWDAATVKLDEVNIKVIKDSNAALNTYLAGDIDQVELQASDVAAYKDDPEFSTMSTFQSTYLQYNLSDKAFQNLNIRKAVSMAIDRDTLASVILVNGSLPATGFVTDGISGDGKKTFRELAGNVVASDIEKAKEYWKAGCDELGFVPELTLLTMDASVHQTVATYIQDCLRTAFGIETDIKVTTKQTRQELLGNNDFSFAITAWGADYDDAMTFLDLFVQHSPMRGNYNDPDYDEFINVAKTTTDINEHVNFLMKAENKLVSEDYVISPLYFIGIAHLTKAGVHNLIDLPSLFDMEFKWASVD